MTENRAKPSLVNFDKLDTNKACNEPFKLELKHPITKKRLGCYVLVLGSESDQYREYTDEIQDKAYKEAADLARNGADPIPQTAAARRKQSIDLLANMTVGFENIQLEGAELTFNIPNAIKFYTRFGWAKNQVDIAVYELGNFMKD